MRFQTLLLAAGLPLLALGELIVDAPTKRIQQRSDPAAEALNRLRGRQNKCSGGNFARCSTGVCCPGPGYDCCSNIPSCVKTGGVCCSAGTCDPGKRCCGTSSCYPTGAQCCPNGDFCDVGSYCYLNAAGQQRCCVTGNCGAANNVASGTTAPVIANSALVGSTTAVNPVATGTTSLPYSLYSVSLTQTFLSFARDSASSLSSTTITTTIVTVVSATGSADALASVASYTSAHPLSTPYAATSALLTRGAAVGTSTGSSGPVLATGGSTALIPRADFSILAGVLATLLVVVLPAIMIIF